MMEAEGIKHPRQLAFDRPSHKFLSFLRRHFGLTSFVPQATNMIVFDEYFAPSTPPPPLPTSQPADHKIPSLSRLATPSSPAPCGAMEPESSRQRLPSSSSPSEALPTPLPERPSSDPPRALSAPRRAGPTFTPVPTRHPACPTCGYDDFGRRPRRGCQPQP
eukprot:gnl/Ergobibamus_cyprinoides/1864.p1 GENE.gnl/Ergobibamus_cyprinoides/1864~~gnl/Ergobibamus_cyprinoides/1864.p1  ORF type:complete len:162 (+),score=10.40 gnl/Ergobibamus_cyprinoides/1864:301-786(+)